jgi:hypothetical protein
LSFRDVFFDFCGGLHHGIDSIVIAAHDVFAPSDFNVVHFREELFQTAADIVCRREMPGGVSKTERGPDRQNAEDNRALELAARNRRVSSAAPSIS